MTSDEINALREVALSNAESYVRAAKLLDGQTLDHIRLHLAVMALEEVGKADLLGMQFIAKVGEEPERPFESHLEDHVKKLFWALWGPSFEREKLTPKQFEEYQGLARNLHDRRMMAAYMDPTAPISPSAKVSKGEADSIVGLAEARIGLEKLRTFSTLEGDDLEAIRWFLKVGNDAEKRRDVFGSRSLDKLKELGNVQAWVRWLRDTYDKHDEEMRELAERELKRARPADGAQLNPKWRVKFRLYSHSHTIRQKALNAWNSGVDDIKLTATGKRVHSQEKKDELLCELTLREGVPVGALWYAAWALSRSLAVALNIATRGLFWWQVPRDSSVFYDEIWDLENNAGLRISERPRLEIDWGNLVLTEADLYHTSRVLAYLMSVRGTEKEGPFNDYIAGIILLSKIDIHLRFEANAFEAFWRALRGAMCANGDWDGTSDFTEAAIAKLGSLLRTTDDLKKHLGLAAALEAYKKGGTPPVITLTEVIGMKLYCDLYLFLVVQAWTKDRLSQSA